MKRFLHSLKLMTAFLLFGAALSLSSCVNDNLDDCPPLHKVKIRYDNNMEFTDLFKQQVREVELYFYNDSGELVKVVKQPVTNPTDDFTIEVEVPNDYYNIVAWCGLVEDTQFEVTHDKDVRVIANNRCQLNFDTRAGESIAEELRDLYHGICYADFRGLDYEEPAEISLTKNTNSLQVTLLRTDGTTVNPADFDIYVEDDNSLMRYDNALISKGMVKYRPFRNREIARSRAGENEGLSVDFSLVRLLTGTGGRLVVVRKSDGKKVIDIPLVEHLLLSKQFEYPQMADFEYLDRKDTYSATFYLEPDDLWWKNIIYINSWRIIYQEAQL